MNIEVKTIGTSLGVYYLFYRNGTFIESCDESEREAVEERLRNETEMHSSLK